MASPGVQRNGRVTSEARRAVALDELQETRAAEFRVGVEIELARKAVQQGLDRQRDIRSKLRRDVRAAREAGATHAQIAAVLQVSVQRAQALSVKDPEVRRR